MKKKHNENWSIQISIELRNVLKQHCKENGIKMKSFVEKIIRDAIPMAKWNFNKEQGMTIKTLFENAMKQYNETWKDVEYSILSDEALNTNLLNIPPYIPPTKYIFTHDYRIWTKNRIYFAGMYNGIPTISSCDRVPTIK